VSRARVTDAEGSVAAAAGEAGRLHLNARPAASNRVTGWRHAGAFHEWVERSRWPLTEGTDVMTTRASDTPRDVHLVAAIYGLRLLRRRRGDLRWSAVRSDLGDGAQDLLGEVPRARRTRSALRPHLVDRLRRLEAVRLRRGPGLLRNADLLARTFKLTPVERDVVVLAVMLQSFEWLGNLFGQERPCFPAELLKRAGSALAVEPARIKQALRRDGVLRTTKMVSVETSRHAVSTGIEVDAQLAEALWSTELSALGLMRHFVPESPPTRLAAEDFAHIEADVRSLTLLMKGALRRRVKGVNVLLHGRPGTGKTELARVVARAAGARLYEVADTDADGDPLEAEDRIGRCAAAQRMMGQTRNALLVFDEIEDAFPSRWNGALGLERSSTRAKSWTHRMIEGAALPTFWIANTIEQMDPATLRRFDLVIEVGVPPQAARRGMIAAELGRIVVGDTQLDRLAADERLAPAHVARAVRVANLMGARPSTDVGATLTYVLERNLAVQGPARAALSANLACGPYDLAFVNASADLAALAAPLAASPQAAICLYGPPGTGKTAWVAHLAASLGRPLRAARASDLLDCMLGGTEKNLASLFRSALAEKAVLFIDEADSFLQDRGRATRSWEVTQVNEMLVQMEAFQGIFVCATNLVDTLDHASLRRFSLKIEFSPLRADQRWAMFQRLTGGPCDGLPRAEVDRLEGLTAGDFATVARQARLTGSEARTEVLVAMLARELVLRKGGGTHAIGFSRQPAQARVR
jgi:transitional endoplasmic reticulum ATPase